MSEKEKKIDEKKKVAISYIFTFYNNVINLTTLYSQYLNLMLELKNKYGHDIGNKFDDEEKKTFTIAVQLCRQACVATYIQYISITEELKQEQEEISKVTAAYEKIKKSFVIDTDELEHYVGTMNSVLVKNVIQNLLESNQDVISDIFQNDKS